MNKEKYPVAYLAECTLATVSAMAWKSKPPRGEFFRQCDIAQFAVDHAENDNDDRMRLNEIKRKNISVKKWAYEIFRKNHSKIYVDRFWHGEL